MTRWRGTCPQCGSVSFVDGTYLPAMTCDRCLVLGYTAPVSMEFSPDDQKKPSTYSCVCSRVDCTEDVTHNVYGILFCNAHLREYIQEQANAFEVSRI